MKFTVHILFYRRSFALHSVDQNFDGDAQSKIGRKQLSPTPSRHYRGLLAECLWVHSDCLVREKTLLLGCTFQCWGLHCNWNGEVTKVQLPWPVFRILVLLQPKLNRKKMMTREVQVRALIHLKSMMKKAILHTMLKIRRPPAVPKKFRQPMKLSWTADYF